MANRLIQDSTLTSIADAIRTQNGSNNTYTPLQMPAAILAISGGGGESVWFDDRNDSVLAYLTASSIYTDANRTTVSVIDNYANISIGDQDCPKSFLGTYNLTPGVANTVGNWSVTTLGKPPRMLKLSGVWNVRDCGGWAADNGKVKFGMLFRGSRLSGATQEDLSLLASVGIKFELDIRDSANASGTTATIPGSTYQNVAINNAYAKMITTEATAAANACIVAMQSIVDDNPVYIHCASGADRTGCICAMLEAVLGVSDTDLDRDFELTDFSDIENLMGHVRSGGSWNGFWAALPTDQTNTKMNVVKFLRDNGATTSLINAFRAKIIDGNPSDIDIPTYRVINSLTNCSSNNSAVSVDGGSSYTATITPNSGYAMQLLTVTMGGTDITATAVSGNTINIASVTGAIVITGLADVIASYTNIVRTSEALDSTAIYNGVGYKNGYYISGSNESVSAGDCCTGLIPYIITSTEQPTDILYLKGYAGVADASHTRLSTWTPTKVQKTQYNGFLSSNVPFDVEQLSTGYYKLTPKSGLHHSINGIGYLRFSFAGTDGANIIITRNEEIT